MSGFVTRFAPSPTGLLHRGSAFSALTVAAAAKAADGRFLLRIEDTDFTRCRPEYEAAIYDDLAWLGLEWETPVRRQSEHRPVYAEVLDRLDRMAVLYRCFRSRRETQTGAVPAAGAGGQSDSIPFRGEALPPGEEAERLARGEAFAWRLSLTRAEAAVGGFDRLTWQETGIDPGERRATPERLGDLVLARKDIGAGYNIAGVVDEGLQGVTHVIRGGDLAEVTSIHRVLQALLGLPTPVYHHHRLLLAEDGAKLSKRHHAEAVRSLRERGVSPQAVRRELGFD